MKHHSYGPFLKLLQAIVSLAWAGAIVLTIYGLVVTTVNENQYAPSGGLSILFLICAGSVLIFWMVGILTVILILMPGITVSEHGFKVHSLVGQSRWLPWSAITRARRTTLPWGWQVGIHGLGPLYWVTGRLLWLGQGAVQIGTRIENYDGLIRTLRRQRPDLFGRQEYAPR